MEDIGDKARDKGDTTSNCNKLICSIMMRLTLNLYCIYIYLIDDKRLTKLFG